MIIPDITVDKKEIYEKIEQYLISLEVPTINISNYFDNLDLILRDGIHTTNFGSVEYGKIIGKKFIDNFKSTIDALANDRKRLRKKEINKWQFWDWHKNF